MDKRHFMEMLKARWAEGKFVCVGLDTDYAKLPTSALGIMNFNTKIVEATADLVCAFKPNIAFYSGFGTNALAALRDTCEAIKEIAPHVPIILDSKRGDILNTNLGYVKEAFEVYGADAVTVHPYLGQEAMQPFLDQKDKGIIVLCRTSNPGADEFQDLPVLVPEEWEDEIYGANDALRSQINGGIFRPLYQHVAWRVSRYWNGNGNCAVVVGAPYPEELGSVRGIVGDLPILIPGVGKQGGKAEVVVPQGMDSKGEGFIINSSRDIIFASSGRDFAEAARKKALELHEEIKTARAATLAARG